MNQNFNYSNSFGFDQIQPPQQFDNHHPQEIPEVISFFDSETKNELYKMMEDFTERMNQELRKQEVLLAAQREQELLAQKQAAQEKQVPSPNSVFRQLIEETCGMNVCEEEKQNMEDTMLELLKDCRQKELYCIHNNVDDLFESALNSKLLSINSQHLDKEKQEVKNIAEPTAKHQTRISPCLKNFKVIHKENIIPLNKTPQISPSIALAPVFSIMEPEDSLSMGDEHLNTIPEKESDEFIKSSVEDLVPIPRESEDTSGSDSENVLPSSDDFSPIFEEKSVTFSNPLFDSNNDFTSSDDESLSDEDVSEDIKIYSNPLFKFDDEYISSDVNPLFDEVLEDIECNDSYDSNLDELTFLVTPLSDSNKDDCLAPRDDIELLLHSDPSISIVSILEGFIDEPPLEENDDLFDLESQENDWKKILYDAPIDDLITEDKVFDLGIYEKSFSPTFVKLTFEDRHYLPIIFVIRIFLPYLTYPGDSPLLLSTGSEDTIFDPGIST
ncbi:hypothetical protein Tco_0321916 [Tanacetum coccineum]